MLILTPAPPTLSPQAPTSAPPPDEAALQAAREELEGLGAALAGASRAVRTGSGVWGPDSTMNVGAVLGRPGGGTGGAEPGGEDVRALRVGCGVRKAQSVWGVAPEGGAGGVRQGGEGRPRREHSRLVARGRNALKCQETVARREAVRRLPRHFPPDPHLGAAFKVATSC